MKPLTPAMIAVALLLGACGGEPAAPVENATVGNAAEATTNFQQEVAALTDDQRKIVFIRAIRDAGLDCQEVTESERAGDGFQWRARCSNGRDHIVSITPDGTAQVVTGAGA